MTRLLLIRDKDRDALRRLLARHLPTVSAWAYGSRVDGGAHDASDLDLALRSPDLTPIPSHALDNFRSALRESNIPILVEARDWARMPAVFHREILSNYVVVREGDASGIPIGEAKAKAMPSENSGRTGV